MSRPNYRYLYDDMITQRNTALERVALLEGEIIAWAAEVERLTVETAAYRSDWRAWEALARLNIEYTGNDPLERLVEENAALRAQLAGEGWLPIGTNVGILELRR